MNKRLRLLLVAGIAVIGIAALIATRSGATGGAQELLSAAVTAVQDSAEQTTGGNQPLQIFAAEEAAGDGQPATSQSAEPQADATQQAPRVTEQGQYSARDELALYIHLFGHLPSNFITKAQATALGWPSGSLEPYAPGKSIGGDRFSNREGLLARKQGRTYTECDVNTTGKSSRGAERIVFSNDGLVYYTGDHYESFTLLYGEP